MRPDGGQRGAGRGHAQLPLRLQPNRQHWSGYLGDLRAKTCPKHAKRKWPAGREFIDTEISSKIGRKFRKKRPGESRSAALAATASLAQNDMKRIAVLNIG